MLKKHRSVGYSRYRLLHCGMSSFFFIFFYFFLLSENSENWVAKTHWVGARSVQIFSPSDKPNKGISKSWTYFLSRSWIASSRRSFCRFPSWAARILTPLVSSESKVVLYIFLCPIRVTLDQKGPFEK